MEQKTSQAQELSVDFILSFRNHPELMKLDSKTIETINKMCINSHKKYKNNNEVSTHNMILKNPKLQNKKDNIENKVNLILNKLSENNIDNLLIEFINNIGQLSSEEYNVVQKTFYMKILSEINFVKIYLKFFNSINYIYNKVQNHNMELFISLIETKFYYDYTDLKLSDEYSFLSEMNTEVLRINNQTIIRNFNILNVLNDDILDECKDILFKQTKYLADIYYWFQSDNNLSDSDIKNINTILMNDKIQTRDRILLESLCKNNNKKEEQKTETKRVDVIKDVLLLEITNIIEEFLLVNELDDVIYFIEKKCTDALSKNKFCYNLIDIYATNNEDKLLDLLKKLYNSEVINKNNINNGIILYKKKINYNESKIINIKNIM